MRNVICVLSLLFISAFAHAEMTPMTDELLASTTGQSGAEVSLDMRLNLDESGNYVCEGGSQFCRIAVAANNRVNTKGKTKWVVLKGVHGQIKVQQLYMEAVTDIKTVNSSGADVTKSGLKLTYNPEKPILVRNLGYEALAAEDDTETQKGYLKVATYTEPGFDFKRETGVLGLQMNANVQIGGTVKIFGIDK